MIPELGHFALILALFIAAAQMHPRLVINAAYMQFALCLLAFLALMWGYISSDFTILNVAENSHTLKPFLYKIAGTWGNHEGSMLLWLLMLSFFGALVAWKNSDPKTLRVMGALGVGFIAYTVIASNPFERIDPPPFDGMGLNPILQDPALSFHPPLLYMGYIGFSVAFAFAVAALWDGKVTKNWASTIKPWVILAWTALSAGIALGSYWAYYELGWGGWWFWDPVENASLMPWLLGTALLHSVIVLEKRSALKRWTILLCILTFSLSILGTFLVRSGVLTSVHAFAIDPARGIFILALLFIYTGGALLLYALRAGGLKGTQSFAPVSRESALVFNNLFLATMTATVLIGTLYPLILSALDAGQISVGPPYFHATFIPLAAPLILLMAVGPFIPWKQGKLLPLRDKLKMIALVTAAILLLVAVTQKEPLLFSLLGIGLGTWLIAGTLWEARLRYKRILPLPQWGMTLAHLGVGIAVIGMTGTGLWLKENTAVLQPGEKMSVSHYELTLESVVPAFGPNYTAIRANISARDVKNGHVFSLAPEKRFYPVSDKNTTEAGIYLRFTDDLYVVMGDRDEQNGWVIAAKTHPYINVLWIGFALLVAGGLTTLARGTRWDKK